MMTKNELKLYALSFFNGAGYACAASTALVWAFPKLAKRNLDPKSRIICGLTGLAWILWQTYRCQEDLDDRINAEWLHKDISESKKLFVEVEEDEAE